MKTILKHTAPVCILLLMLHTAVKCQGILIESGGNVVNTGAPFIVINNGGFTNNGIFTPATGTLSFAGTAATAASFINGSSTSSFYNLSLDKTVNGIQLNQHAAVSNMLSLLNGDSIFLNNYNIDLGSTGTISGESAARRITGTTGGYIQITQLLNAPAAVNPGNLGLLITSSSNMGSTVIRRGHLRQTNGSNYGIERYFDILPAVNTGLDATLRLYYQQGELAGITETDLMLFSSNDFGSTWQIRDYNTLDISQNFIEQNGFNELYRVTLASLYAPLPVTQLMLDAVASNGQNIINWKTTGENALLGFVVERCGTDMVFQPLETVPAKGNQLITSLYSYIDKNPLPGTSYYRLKLLEANSHHNYSKTVAVKQPAPSDPVKAFPNPAGRILHINCYSNSNTEATIRITGISGNTVWMQKNNIHKGFNEINCSIAHLPNGIYTLQVLLPGSNWQSSFIKTGTD